jgi:hypothetical protein
MNITLRQASRRQCRKSSPWAVRRSALLDSTCETQRRSDLFPVLSTWSRRVAHLRRSSRALSATRSEDYGCFSTSGKYTLHDICITRISK